MNMNNCITLIRSFSLGSLILAALLTSLMACSEPDKTPVEKAVDEIGEGFENAAEELEPDKTPMEELGEAVEDAGESIQDSAN